MSKGSVLVVDDEENILGSLEGILHDEGYKVITVEEGETALNIIESDHPDLVLLDIWLPGMDGIEVLKSAKKSGTDSEFIMMSGHGSIDTAVKATKLGAFDFIEKPLSLDNLLLMVNLAMKKRQVHIADHELKVPCHTMDDFIGKSEAAKKIRSQLKTIWKENLHITITGEYGTGKTLIAGILCSQILDKETPCEKIDCASIPVKQANKVLFGTGGKSADKPGKFELAKGGVLILDNLDSLPTNVQSKILKKLNFTTPPTSKAKKKPMDEVRVIAIIEGDLDKKVEAGSINRELLEIIKPGTIFLPSLKERPEDIELLANYFLRSQEKGVEGQPRTLGKMALEIMNHYSWPGNVRELQKTVEEIQPSDNSQEQVTPYDLPETVRHGYPISSTNLSGDSISLTEAEFLWNKESITYHLKKNKWDIKKTAKNMGLTSTGLKQRLKRYGIDLKTLNDQNFSNQNTLKRSVVLCGQGLHSGIKTGLILSPLPPNSGIVFGNISTGETIRAHLDHVDSTYYATCLRKGKKTVRTIEHILAVLHMYRINNLLIKIGDEVPIMDGSAKDFCDLIEDGGIEDQNVACEELVIGKPCSLTYKDNHKSICIEPAETFTVHYTMDYPPPIGRQEFLFKLEGEEHFKKEIAPARTFGFLKDYEKLEEMGLASGGRLSNVVLLDDEKVINTTLRFSDEFARHKILDIIGDFYLLGKIVRGKITAKMTGHRENISLLRKLRENSPSIRAK